MTPDPTRSGTHAAAMGDGYAEIPCVWFFLPLPHPLALPHGYRSEALLPRRTLMALEGPTTGLTSSLLLHQMEHVPPSHLVDSSRLMGFAASSVAGHARVPDAAEIARVLAAVDTDSPPALFAGQTVAEVVVFDVPADDERELVRALDIAIEHVRFVQRSVAHVTQEAVRLIARATLPPLVPTFTGVAYVPSSSGLEVRHPRFDESVEWVVPECAPAVMLGVVETLGDSDLARMASVGRYIATNAAFHTYADLRREALVQHRFDGNDRLALIALATAGEVFLDTVLLLMLWEERVLPADAATYFNRSEGHTARVRRNFPNRLGGAWDPDALTPAGSYQRDLVRLRHRVVHAGHEPDRGDVDGAVSTLLALEAYVGDRLAAEANLNRYPRTAMAWMAENGLRRRGRWTRRMQQLTTDPREPHWDSAFIRWRHHVDRALNPDAPAPGADPARLILYADKTADDTIRWVIHDPSSGYAAVVDPLAVRNADDVERLTATLTSIDSTDLGDRRVSILLDVVPPPDVEWLPDHDVFPELVIFPGPPAS